MSVSPGQRILHYELVEKIGEGGMGVVWRAVDTTLDRAVAIKILPDAFAADADRLARFEREAKLLASLNHPNIATVHGLHEQAPSTGTGQPLRFLAMELAEGENLTQRIARGKLPLDEALGIARQIASAMESAHENGVVHRDLKPANVMLAPDGNVKVLDFGLAKALTGDPESQNVDPALSPTMTSAGTAAGMILGTAAYMSPEQARGKPIDRRVDLWAFGCVLYEMLTGRAVHSGDTVSDTLAAVLLREPDWNAVPDSTPAGVRRLLERCLRKDPRSRLRDAGDARVMLEEVIGGEVDEPSAAPQAVGASSGRRRLTWLLVGAALVAGIGLGFLLRTPTAEEPARRIHFRITQPNGVTPGLLALSPDGKYVIYPVADESGTTNLWLRPLGSTDPRRLTDLPGASHPFWSPDSRDVGFYAQGQLWRIGLDGGAARPIGSVDKFYGATWNRDDVILAGTEGPILRFSAEGVREPTPVTEPAEVESGHMWPDFLPDGNRFVYLADSNEMEKHRIVLGALDGSVSATLATGSMARSLLRFDPAGWLLWAQGQQLVAQQLDLGSNVLKGTPVLLADRVIPVGGHHAMAFAVSGANVIAYQQGSGFSELVWVDRSGKRLDNVGERGSYANPVLSPDGRLLAVETQNDEQADKRPIWIYDLQRGTRTLLTKQDTLNDSSTWTPDGRRVIFDSDRDGKWKIFSKSASGAGEAEAVLGDREFEDLIVQDLSDDGRWLLFSVESGKSNWDLWIVDLESTEREPLVWLASATDDDYARFSPHGEWIAYANNESGRHEVYLRPRDPERRLERYQISVQGGHEPKWRRDGRELFYRDERGKFFSVPIDLVSDPVDIAIPEELFEIKTPVVQFERDTYDVTADGQRFLFNASTGTDDGVVQLVTGWRP